MSQSALALSFVLPTKWTILNGSMAGTVRLMNAPSFTMGRSPECDIVLLNDPKISRLHVTISSGANGIEVTGESDKNAVLLNGQPIERAYCQDGDIITVGDTQLQMAMIAPSRQTANLSIAPPAAAAQAPMFTGAVAASPGGLQTSMPPSTSNVGRFAIYGIIGVVIILVVMPTKGKKKELQIRSEQQITADIDTANKLRESAEKSGVRVSDQSVTGRQAQENYVRGFRDFERGQYERSLISFQSCLALNPDHVLCNRYMRLAQRKFDEVVQYQMVLGRKYRDQNQYRACRSAFRNVMVMIKDSNSAIFIEAKANYDACDQLVEGRF